MSSKDVLSREGVISLIRSQQRVSIRFRELIAKHDAEIRTQLASALEAQQKAERERDEAESLLASATDLLNMCARENYAVQADRPTGIKFVIHNIWAVLSGFRTERDEARAEIHRLTRELSDEHKHSDEVFKETEDHAFLVAKVKRVTRHVADGCGIHTGSDFDSLMADVRELAKVHIEQNWQCNELRAEVKRLNVENAELRQLLWLWHGCESPALYGDDGKMDCNRCLIDFKGMPVEDIRGRWHLITFHKLNAAMNPPAQDTLTELPKEEAK